MKIFSISTSIVLLISGLFFTSCNSQSKNLLTEDLSDNSYTTIVNNGNQTATAQKDTYSEFQKFIKEANIRLGQNEKSLSKWKLDTSLAKNESAGIDDSEINELEINNSSLKNKLDDYVQNGTGNWKTFESEFYCELDEIELASK